MTIVNSSVQLAGEGIVSRRGAGGPFSIWRVVISRLAELARELPSIARGLSTLWAPFRRQVFIIFGINTVIALWETTLTLATAWQINALQSDLSYFEVVGIITLTMVAFYLLHEIVFPLIREFYILKHFRVDFPQHIAMQCIRWSTARGVDTLPPHKTPVLQAGCPAAYTLTEMLLRDPQFAIRGLFLMAWFWVTDPFLMLLGTVGMVVDILVVLHMDARIYGPYGWLRQSEFTLWGSVFRVLDDESAPGRTSRENRALIDKCDGAWGELKKATVHVGCMQLRYQELIRNPISLMVRWGTMLIIGWWVSTGEIKVGDFLMYVGLIGRASDPFNIFYAFQQEVMQTREPLYQLGKLCGIDFGIAPPEHAA